MKHNIWKDFFDHDEEVKTQLELEKEFEAFQKLETTESLFPYQSILEDTLITRKNTLVQMFNIEGFDNISTSNQKNEMLYAQRLNMLNNLDENIKLKFITRRKQTPQHTTQGKQDNPTINEINKLWNKQFQKTYNTELYLIVSKSYERLTKQNINTKLNEFNSLLTPIKSNLSSYQITQLTKTGLEQFTKSLLDIFYDIEFDRKLGTVSYDHTNHKQILNICTNQSDSTETLFKTLSSLNIEYDICQNIEPIDTNTVQRKIETKIKFNQSLGTTFATGIKNQDLDDTRELVANDLIKIFHYSCYVKLNTKDILEFQSQCSDLGIHTIKETTNIKHAFLSFINDYEKHDTRKILLSTINIADFIPLFNSYQGLNKNSFGNTPITQFKTISNSLYNFNFHQEEAKYSTGHTLIIGGTGAGKSTLLSFLLMNSLKYEQIKILAFDSKNGLRIPISIFDGNYSDVSNAGEVTLNPFSLKESLTNKQFLIDFLDILAGGNSTLDEKATLEEVIRQNYDILAKNNIQGSLVKLEDIFGIKRKQNIAKRIEKWIQDKDLSQYFNNETDNLNFQKPINAFDMGDILENEMLLSPTSSYIFHKFTDTIKNNPSPHIFLIDEMARYLSSQHFTKHIRTCLKESRKQNGIFIGCVQEPTTFLQSPYIKKDEFLANIATMIIFPDSKANEDDYKELDLNDNEFNFIKNGNARQVLIKQFNGKSSIINVNMQCLGKYLKVFSSSQENLNTFKNSSSTEEFLNKAL
jgi:type IV secretion/conjugal transfer VirB4 family ATPase